MKLTKTMAGMASALGLALFTGCATKIELVGVGAPAPKPVEEAKRRPSRPYQKSVPPDPARPPALEPAQMQAVGTAGLGGCGGNGLILSGSRMRRDEYYINLYSGYFCGRLAVPASGNSAGDNRATCGYVIVPASGNQPLLRPCRTISASSREATPPPVQFLPVDAHLSGAPIRMPSPEEADRLL